MALGIPQDLMDAIRENIDSSGIDEMLKPVFAFIAKLTLKPADMTGADADQVFAAGWDERALHDAIEVCALFNFMNRYAEGHGLIANPENFKQENSVLKAGYLPLIDVLGLK